MRKQIVIGASIALGIAAVLVTAYVMFRSDRWEPVRDDVRSFLREANRYSSGQSENISGVLQQGTVMCVHARRVEDDLGTEGQRRVWPEDLMGVRDLCASIDIIVKASQAPQLKEPQPLVAPIYQEPEYEGAFEFSGNYEKVGVNLLVQRKGRLYLLPFATVEGDALWGKAKGYVRPLGKESMVNGRNAQFLDVVTKGEMQKDQAEHAERVAKAKADYQKQSALFETAKAEYSGKVEEYRKYHETIGAMDLEKTKLFAQIPALARLFDFQLITQQPMRETAPQLMKNNQANIASAAPVAVDAPLVSTPTSSPINVPKASSADTQNSNAINMSGAAELTSEKPYVVISASISQSLPAGKASADKMAEKLHSAGFTKTTVHDGQDYPNFKCCFWVVVVDSFDTIEKAKELRDKVDARGFDAYVKNAFSK